jgi:hypothetical protein
MILFELAIFGIGTFFTWKLTRRLWRWADVTEKMDEIKTVEQQYHRVRDFTSQHEEVGEKKQTVNWFKQQ